MLNIRPWDNEQVEILKKLIERNVSLARAAVVLNRRQSSVQKKARELGKPFPGVRAQKAALRVIFIEADTFRENRR
ncbi:hypothetical protein FNL55_12330 [Tardiphaga sp. vice352]|uniref:hypothetical protein n=1 Tax=unclassified Tardiphaga TaxID=2631404 RepID=UPI0011654191|nr:MULTISPECIES: hypothetical protein [unclassified Tardiphaga]MBC7623393.1 hypothetical protein [Burkholderiales bacterium]QDM16753.1 hypothetical protein FNL53_13040 [Tardiphaga sp. vice278]QDM32028.1 hypothetical protein FNL55_12330 [Tardiphaga sp. vice352]